MKHKLMHLVINFGLAVTSIVIMLVLAEIALRLTPYKNMLPKMQLDPLRYYSYADPVKGYDIVKNAPPAPVSVEGLKYDLWSNELGCFDVPYRDERDSILLVGDSFTFAFAPFQDKWGTKIENLLERRVLKCGVGGYGTKQELLKASEIVSGMKHKPKLIIVGYFINDLEDDYLFPASTVLNGYPVRTQYIKDMNTGEILKRDAAALEEQMKYGVKEYPSGFFLRRAKWWIEQESIIIFLAKNSLRPILLAMPVIGNMVAQTKVVLPPMIAFLDRPWIQNVWSVHLSHLKAFKTLAARSGSNLLIVIIPSREQVYPHLTNWKGVDREKPQKILRAFLEQEGIPHMDLLPLFAEYSGPPSRVLDTDRGLYWRNDPHLNRRGNQLLGLLASQYILENDLLAVRGKNDKMVSIREQLDALR